MNKFSILIIFLTTALFSQDSLWIEQVVPFDTGMINGISDLSLDTSWAVGVNDKNGTAAIIKTTNGGEEWILQNSGIFGVLKSIAMVNADLGFTAGINSNNGHAAILKTINGGDNWENLPLPITSGSLNDIKFNSETNGISVGSGPKGILILYTIDGTNWNESQAPEINAILENVYFSDELTAFAVGTDWLTKTPYLLRTTDGGASWEELVHPEINGSFMDIKFITPEVGFVVGSINDDFLILQTRDGGDNWSIVEIETENTFVRTKSNKQIRNAQNQKCINYRGMGRKGLTIVAGDKVSEAEYAFFVYLFEYLDELYRLFMGFYLIDVEDNTAIETSEQRLPSLTNPGIKYQGRSISSMGTNKKVFGSKDGIPKMYGELINILSRIDITPQNSEITIGQVHQFKAKGYNSQGKLMEFTPTWTATGGSITQSGKYTAGDTPGDYTVTASAQGISQTVSVKVKEGPLNYIALSPKNKDLLVGESYKLTAAGFDRKGNQVVLDLIWMGTGGFISPGDEEMINYRADSSFAVYTAQEAGEHIVVCIDSLTGISDTAHVHVTLTYIESMDQIPAGFELFQNYPNPFQNTTCIKFNLPKDCNVKLIITDIQGQQIAELLNRDMIAGYHSVEFNMSKLESGIYFYKLEANHFSGIRKMVLIR
jgi:photosystem II stability/assembly factor-like uncharacterized protein